MKKMFLDSPEFIRCEKLVVSPYDTIYQVYFVADIAEYDDEYKMVTIKPYNKGEDFYLVFNTYLPIDDTFVLTTENLLDKVKDNNEDGFDTDADKYNTTYLIDELFMNMLKEEGMICCDTDELHNEYIYNSDEYENYKEFMMYKFKDVVDKVLD